jgi:hypothetical protein
LEFAGACATLDEKLVIIGDTLVAVAGGVAVSVGVNVAVGVGVSVRVGEAVGKGVREGVLVMVGVAVLVAVAVKVAVGVAVSVGVLVGMGVSVMLAVTVGVSDGNCTNVGNGSAFWGAQALMTKRIRPISVVINKRIMTSSVCTSDLPNNRLNATFAIKWREYVQTFIATTLPHFDENCPSIGTDYLFARFGGLPKRQRNVAHAC